MPDLHYHLRMFDGMGVAMGAGEFSAGAAVIGLLKQSLLGILIGGTLGYMAAFLISHEKFDFLAEYAPVVTLMAVIGAYMGADGMHASGFMAVFVFGIMLGNMESLGFKRSEVITCEPKTVPRKAKTEGAASEAEAGKTAKSRVVSDRKTAR